ncbi:MAG: sulfotransferase [Rhodopila sp.]|nr:sulfotransferase [Rhodopila sp.]
MTHHQAGNANLAEAGYRAVLKLNPDEPDALNLLGLILQERGALDESLTLIRKALRVDPDFPEALTNLARGELVAGHADKAAASARHAIRLDPDLGEAHLQLGAALLSLRDNSGALTALRQAVALMPDAVPALTHLGTTLMRLGQHREALPILQHILTYTPENIEAIVNLGTVLATLGRLEEAEHWHRKGVALKPNDSAALGALATTLYAANRPEEALASCVQALARAPRRVDLWLTRGTCLADLGRFQEAEDVYRHVLLLAPDSADARRGLAVIGKQAADAGEVELLERKIADPDLRIQDRITAGFALGGLLDRNGEYDRAFAAFDTANRLSRQQSIAAGKTYNLPALTNEVNWLASVFNPGSIATMSAWGDPSEIPVFVVGMPRSGTTLVEQIAASHSRVFGAGELIDISRLLDRINKGRSFLHPVEWDPAEARREASAHVARLAALGHGASRVIDKLPDNVIYLGHIATLFPNARFVVCRRDLRDVCLSAFFQYFKDEIGWSQNLSDCAVRAREISRLMDHWVATLPGRILEVRYEQLVANLEGESRRLIDFLGLEWDPACLAFHQTERTVQTASRWQVRQPLYTTSVGKWRHYRKHLGPLIDGLKGLVPEGD